MKTIKAYVRTSATDMNVELVDISCRSVDQGEVRVQMHALGVGIHDRYFIPPDATFPYIIGLEGSGVITEIGAGVGGFSVGDRVMLTSVLLAKGGCWAESAVVPADALIQMPKEMAFTTAAAIPIAGKTALECLRNLALVAGDSLFIAGASGAVGSLVIQLAAARGIHVCGSASAKNQDYMLSMGAKKVVDYQAPDWKTHVMRWCPAGVTAALAIQPGTGADSIDVTKDGGRVILVSGDHAAPLRGISVAQLQHHDDTAQALPGLVADINAGRISQFIEQVFPFEEALSALRKTETRHARGKTVVNMSDQRNES